MWIKKSYCSTVKIIGDVFYQFWQYRSPKKQKKIMTTIFRLDFATIPYNWLNSATLYWSAYAKLGMWSIMY